MYTGDFLERVILYIHGKGGSHLEAEQYRKSCSGFDITGVNYTDDFPWIVEEQIKAIIDIVRRKDLTDVAILVPHNEMVKIVGEYLSDLNINFEQKYSDKRDYFNNKENLDFSTTNLKVMTYHSAKGLQFETVFLPMI